MVSQNNNFIPETQFFIESGGLLFIIVFFIKKLFILLVSDEAYPLRLEIYGAKV